MSEASYTTESERIWTFEGQRLVARKLTNGLHIVATPIGNLADITLRALSTLAAADVILAEDTRMTRRLLDHYGISTPTRRFDAHSSDAQRQAVIAAVQAGAAYALVSDAGTPLLSDPGSSLVVEATAAGIAVFPVPGPSALLAGLVVAGLPADRFFFEGFLPVKSGDRRRRLRVLADVPGALVFYEAPHRVEETLADLITILGDRPAAAARELTKLYETVVRGTLSTLQAHYTAEAPRGEFVLIVGAGAAEGAMTQDDVDTRLQALMQTMSVKDAAAVAAADLGLPKREVYARALVLAGKNK
ncbi:MAG: 16S rRNA (cytidine(1402)-2'-O)-methyltransferase [Beijerinckiaceae bacterium]